MARFEYQITIGGADNGFVVQAGCKSLVFKDKDADIMLEDIKEYITGGNKGRIAMLKKYFPEVLEQTACSIAKGTVAGLGGLLN